MCRLCDAHSRSKWNWNARKKCSSARHLKLLLTLDHRPISWRCPQAVQGVWLRMIPKWNRITYPCRRHDYDYTLWDRFGDKLNSKLGHFQWAPSFTGSQRPELLLRQSWNKQGGYRGHSKVIPWKFGVSTSANVFELKQQTSSTDDYVFWTNGYASPENSERQREKWSGSM